MRRRLFRYFLLNAMAPTDVPDRGWHARPCRALISIAEGGAAGGALVACMLTSMFTTPVVDRQHLPFAAVAFSAVVSLMPGFSCSTPQRPSLNQPLSSQARPWSY